MRCFGASLWRFPSRLHARGEPTDAARQRSTPSVLHLRTGVRIPPPPAFARLRRATAWQARHRAPDTPARFVLAGPVSREVCHAVAPKARRRTPLFARKFILRIPFRWACCSVSGMSNPKTEVYVLESLRNPDRHYVGVTADVSARLVWHNDGRSHHTSKHRPWRLIASMEFTDDGVAARFERYLKTGSGRAFAKRHFK